MSIFDGLWKTIGRQLRHPAGFLGRLIGAAMAIANRRPNQLALDALKVVPGDVVLELGFGPGRAIKALAALVGPGRVIGIDRSVAMLARASRYNRQAIDSGRIQLMRGHFDALPWPAESVDRILAVNVVYFFHEDAAEIREARRVLRPGGVMAIYATDKSVMARWKSSGPDTHRIFDRHDLVALLCRGGFDDDAITMRLSDVGFGVVGILAVARKECLAPTTFAP
jgi:SAM-dependent methyltransferase